MLPFLLATFAVAGHTSYPLTVPQSTLPRVSSSGVSLIVNGQPRVLHSVNLGGWFVEEIWMTPWVGDPPEGSTQPKIGDDYGLWQELSQRFGGEGMTKVRNAYRNNWVTKTDFNLIKKTGFDSVRLPILDELLHEKDGLKKLDSVINMASDAGLYVILDMHGTPGRQSTDQPTGRVGQNHLWSNQADKDHLLSDWQMLGRRYKNNPTVAMFDLINEPMGAKDASEVYQMMGSLIEGIRKVDTNTVLLVEDGYKGFDTAPSPADMGWKNVCFSLHFYNWDSKKPADHMVAVHGDIQRAKKVMDAKGWPMYVGEFDLEPNGGPEVIKTYTQALNDAGFSWAYWTWKVYPAKGTLGNWGIVRPGENRITLNPFTDSLPQLLAKIKQIRTEKMDAPADILNSFSVGK